MNLVRRIDELGRVVIPKEIRRYFGLIEQEPLEFSIRGDEIIIKRYKDLCEQCGYNLEEIKVNKTVNFCPICGERVNNNGC